MSGIQFFNGFTPSELNDILARAQVKISPWGQRQVVIADCNIKMDLLLLKDRVHDVAQNCLQHIYNRSEASFLPMRFLGEDLTKKINTLLVQSDRVLQASNIFKRSFTWIRELPRRVSAAHAFASLVGRTTKQKIKAWGEVFFRPLNHKLSTLAFRAFSKEEFIDRFMQGVQQTLTLDARIARHEAVESQSSYGQSKRIFITQNAFDRLRAQYRLMGSL